eukprot:TRINITY_DN42_c0_g1_i5.p2 TRINITY_DN42_c0_g1~~TRINITY_DN42_c0_g1_i5.p2  ORF type:complete len:190 (+),score=14.48 TRINITY_DN42_c0_g1_i5:1333-1902(+)
MQNVLRLLPNPNPRTILQPNMSLKTTCGGCRLLKANSDGNPITKSGEEVGLCQLTRPEVKERIQEDKLPDKRTCPKCQHDVGDHVAKDDDGMFPSHFPSCSVSCLFRCVCHLWIRVCRFPSSIHPRPPCLLSFPFLFCSPLLLSRDLTRCSHPTLVCSRAPALSTTTAMTWPPQPITAPNQVQGMSFHL